MCFPSAVDKLFVIQLSLPSALSAATAAEDRQNTLPVQRTPLPSNLNP
jgi:hypothetical protein